MLDFAPCTGRHGRRRSFRRPTACTFSGYDLRGEVDGYGNMRKHWTVGTCGRASASRRRGCRLAREQEIWASSPRGALKGGILKGAMALVKKKGGSRAA